jgi:hypothetical protein
MKVSREAMNAADALQAELEQRDLVGIGLLAGAGAVGALLAQEVAERVLGALGKPIDPSSPTNLGLSALAKVGFALLWVTLGVTAGLTSGLGLIAVGIGAFGALVSAGVDFFDVLQRGGLPGSMPSFDAQPAPQGQPAPPSPQPEPATDGGVRDDYAAYGD